MTEFILNDRTIRTDAPLGTVLLDVIRYHEHLPGTRTATCAATALQTRIVTIVLLIAAAPE